MTFFNFARFLPVFLLKKCPFFARFFIIFSPFEEIATLPHRCRPALPPEELRDGDLQAEPGRPHRLPQVERLVEGLQRGSFEAEREDEGLLFHVLQNLAMSRLILNTLDFTDFSNCQNIC